MWSDLPASEIFDYATEEQAFVLTNFEEKLELTWSTYELYMSHKHYEKARSYFDRFTHILYILAKYLEENEIDIPLSRFKALYTTLT